MAHTWVARVRSAAGVSALGVLIAGSVGTLPAAAESQNGAADPLEIRVTTLAHPETSVRWGRAEGMVEAPIADVLKVVSNYGAYHEFLPHFRASRVLSQRGKRALVYMEAGVARNTLTIWAQLKITPHSGPGGKQVIEAHMTKGNLDHMLASWELTPIDATHTLVAFQILVDPKVPLPASLVTSENEKASRKTIGALRKRLKS